MGSWIDIVMAGMVITSLILVATGRLTRSVTVIALEGLMLASLPILVEGSDWSIRSVLFSLAILVLKGWLIPSMLLRAMNESKVHQENQPYLGHTASLIIVSLAFVGANAISQKLPWPTEALSSLMVPVAFFTVFAGIFIIVSRRQAVSQVIGYLQLEYGLFVFGMSHPYEHSYLVEVAVLLDILVAVMVMGIAILHINREMEHIDTERLSVLRDFRR